MFPFLLSGSTFKATAWYVPYVRRTDLYSQFFFISLRASRSNLPVPEVFNKLPSIKPYMGEV